MTLTIIWSVSHDVVACPSNHIWTARLEACDKNRVADWARWQPSEADNTRYTTLADVLTKRVVQELNLRLRMKALLLCRQEGFATPIEAQVRVVKSHDVPIWLYVVGFAFGIAALGG